VKGLLISLEGVEGSGKSTQAGFLLQELEKRLYDVSLVREPGGTTVSEKLREILLSSPAREPIDALTELFLYLAARRQLVVERLIPLLAKGGIVICDRFADATVAYQSGGRRLPPGLVANLNEMAMGMVRPALTAYLDLDPEVGLARIQKAKQQFDRLEQETLAFHQRVRQCYLDLAAREPRRIKVYDATQSPDVLRSQILDAVLKLLNSYHRP
jgi:dTMP kinase